MAAIIPDPYANYPPRWATFDGFVVAARPGAFLFSGSIGDINRFAARYKAARCFRSVEFEGVSNDTAAGYSALVHLLLTYSAFEHLLRCIGVKMKDSAGLLTEAELATFLARLRLLDGQAEVFGALRQHLNTTYQQQLQEHLAGSICNPWYLAGGLRHGFAHGTFTATPANVPPQAVARVCRFMRDALFKAMDREFKQRVVQFEQAMNP